MPRSGFGLGTDAAVGYLLVANEAVSSGRSNGPDAAINPEGSVLMSAINSGDLSASAVTDVSFTGPIEPGFETAGLKVFGMLGGSLVDSGFMSTGLARSATVLDGAHLDPRMIYFPESRSQSCACLVQRRRPARLAGAAFRAANPSIQRSAAPAAPGLGR